MPKAKTVFACTDCGAEYPKWQGQCTACGAWNAIEEAPLGTASTGYAGAAAGPSRVQAMADVEWSTSPRLLTGIAELDRVLGGGLVAGSAVLLGGHPGAGKSTLLLQALGAIAAKAPVLYVSGEESPQQVAMRAARLGLDQAPLHLLAETEVGAVLAAAVQHRPRVLVIDSIQVMQVEGVASAPGSVTQVRESAARLVRYAKESATVLLLVGHVTKEGHLAGPKVLEHMIDTSMMLESSDDSRYRTLRTHKNRFGAVNELGVFAMLEQGLREVKNPSALFLSGRSTPVPGTLVTALWEGTRPLLVELQVLLDDSHHGQPRRLAVGMDNNRLALLLAVLHRHGGIFLGDQDVFVNVVGGVRVEETSADLALLLALVSSMRNRALPTGLVVLGEVGLSGEIRPVAHGVDRLQEATKHGFSRAVVPAGNRPRGGLTGMQVEAVGNVAEAIAACEALWD
ncbi:MAG: DNA repair protein RadA [Pseudomonadota bacterium]|nr:DNA repair protein RadA [Pseudomonadota bacterium]